MFINANVPQRLRKKSAIPAVGFVIPGADHHAVLDDNDPDMYEAMIARTDGHVFRGFKPGQDLRWKALCSQGFQSLCRFGVNGFGGTLSADS